MSSLRSRIIYQLYRLTGSPFDDELPLTQQRTNIERQSKFARMPAGIDSLPVTIGDLPAEWVRPQNGSQDRAILYLHGGGYTMGSCRTHRALVAQISHACRTQALLIDYRLAPENPFPAALEDAITAYYFLVSEGFQPCRIVIAGDSAGGGLAVAVTVLLRDRGDSLPAGLVCLSPWADLSLSGDTISTCAKTDPLISHASSLFHASCYIGSDDPKSPLISPVFAELSKFPPLLIQVGEYEILRSDATRLAENARQAGVEVTLEVWPGMWHVWQALAGYLPEADRAIESIGEFVHQKMQSIREVG